MYDTFVALSNTTLDGFTIFGKTSWRPKAEPQLITYSPQQDNIDEDMVQCTHIGIPQVSKTNAVLMSQPYWMFGCEMGVNKDNVAIGNEPIYTREQVQKEGLLGTDLVRLGLERSTDAEEALGVIIDLLEEHGQGGDYRNDDVYWSYHNSFLIADPDEAYVIETADKWWIVEKVEDFRILSNQLSIHGKGDRRKEGIIDYAVKQGYCENEEEFDFANTFMKEQLPTKLPLRFKNSLNKDVVQKNKGKITIEKVLEFFRELEDGETEYEDYFSAALQISHLKFAKTSTHWFTGGPLSKYNIIKPYIFPIEDQRVNKPGPYSRLKNDWFWNLNKNYIRPEKGDVREFKEKMYLNEMKAIERNIFDKVRKLEHQENTLEPVEYRKKMDEVNNEVWKKAYELVSLKPQKTQ